MRKSVYTRESEILAETMSSARKDAGLHQTELADQLGVDQSVISNIERGHRRIDVIELYKMAKLMKRDPVDLFKTVVRKWDNMA